MAAQRLLGIPNWSWYLLLGTMSTHAMNQFLYQGMAFDPVRDLAPISLVL